jgi:hypothetical protein
MYKWTSEFRPDELGINVFIWTDCLISEKIGIQINSGTARFVLRFYKKNQENLREIKVKKIF